jgi:hypothetical protein
MTKTETMMMMMTTTKKTYVTYRTDMMLATARWQDMTFKIQDGADGKPILNICELAIASLNWKRLRTVGMIIKMSCSDTLDYNGLR